MSSSTRNTLAAEFHRAATILTFLMVLWGAIALIFPPWDPFGPPSLAQLVLFGALLIYLVAAWNRPRYRIAQVIIAVVIAWTMVRLPWAVVEWCRLGRPLEAFTVPELAAVTIGLQYPGRRSHGVVLIWLFCAQGLFAFFYARYVGLADQVPLTEPMGALTFPMIALGVLFVRQRTDELAKQDVHARAEVEALDRIRPMFEHARDVLDKQVAILSDELPARIATSASKRVPVTKRVLDQLVELRNRLGCLVATDDAVPSLRESEQRLLDHEAQSGATMLAALGVVISVPAAVIFRSEVAAATLPLLVLLFVAFAGMLTYLVIQRHQPSASRATWSVILLVVLTIPIIDYNQFWLIEAGRPYAPFFGHKLIMGMLGLTLGARFKLGVAFIVFTAVNALVLWFVLDLGAQTNILESSEPFPTLIYMVVGLSSLRRLERRHHAAIQLHRDEAEAAMMLRRALMFLALRDQLNTPVQTLVFTATGAIEQLPERSGERVQKAVDELVDLSHSLAALDVAIPGQAEVTSFDAAQELRRPEPSFAPNKLKMA